MKKIIALVLALALALSLCTVAMASVTGPTKSESVDVDDVTIYKLDKDEVFYEKQKATLTSVTKTVKDDDVTDKGVHTVFADKYLVDYEDVAKADEVFYVVAEAVANCKLVIGNTTLYAVVSDKAISTDEVVSAKVAKDSDLNCGSYFVDTNKNGKVDEGEKAAKAYIVDGDAYKANDGANWALYNGEFVTYGAALATVPHNFEVKNVTFKATDSKGNLVPVAVKCTDCGKTFDVIAAGDRDANKTAAFYQVLPEMKNSDKAVVVVKDKYYAVVGTEAAAATTTTTVDSSKTFDAGVAMYVGLSLMSVAGSAVVIGKKKEF